MNVIRRNLGFIAGLRAHCVTVPETIIEHLVIIQTVHDQQRTMLNTRSRLIVHGKAGHETEFGAKLTASLEDGFAGIERLSWAHYNEAGELQTIYE